MNGNNNQDDRQVFFKDLMAMVGYFLSYSPSVGQIWQ